jgi:hypothetical protein
MWVNVRWIFSIRIPIRKTATNRSRKIPSSIAEQEDAVFEDDEPDHLGDGLDARGHHQEAGKEEREARGGAELVLAGKPEPGAGDEGGKG